MAGARGEEAVGFFGEAERSGVRGIAPRGEVNRGIVFGNDGLGGALD